MIQRITYLNFTVTTISAPSFPHSKHLLASFLYNIIKCNSFSRMFRYLVLFSYFSLSTGPQMQINIWSWFSNCLHKDLSMIPPPGDVKKGKIRRRHCSDIREIDVAAAFPFFSYSSSSSRSHPMSHQSSQQQNKLKIIRKSLKTNGLLLQSWMTPISPT